MSKNSVLEYRDFRFALATKFFMTLGLQMQSVVVGWQIFKLTQDPLALGFIGLAEAIPYMSCLLWAGHVTDLSEKKRMIMLSDIGFLVCATAFFLLAKFNVNSVGWYYLVIGAAGICRAYLWPSSAAYIDMTIPKAIYSQAAGWNSTLWQLGAILGPLLGGWVYSVSGAAVSYAGVVLILAVGVTVATRLTPIAPQPAQKKESALRSLMGGIKFVFSAPAMLGALSLDMFAVLFGGAVALLPIFSERLGAGATGLGWLRAAPSLGALIMAQIQSHRPPFRRPGIALLTGVAIFGVCMILFALSDFFVFSFLFLALSGMADNISVVIRASIVQAMTPNFLRGRVSSVNGMFISSSNEIGAFESGVAARLLGVVPSVVIGGVMTLLCVAVTAWKAPQLKRLTLTYDPVRGEPTAPQQGQALQI